jgi:hypothetical protein
MRHHARKAITQRGDDIFRRAVAAQLEIESKT